MPEDFDDAEDLGAGATIVIDDGRNWTAWHVWNMRSRYRMSRGMFEHPPARPLVSRPIIKKARATRKKKRQFIFDGDF